MDTKNKHPIISIRMTIIIGIMVFFSFLAAGIPYYATGAFMDGVSCDGVEYFYTGDGFSSDAYSMNYTFNESEPRTPGGLFQYGGDCKSVSHAIMCLADKYNISCMYYTNMRYDPTASRTLIGHLGIKCNVTGVWEAMN